MSTVGVGEVVRIRISSVDIDEVKEFCHAIECDTELAKVLTAMPESPEARHGDFGLWELAQEFIVSGLGGATSVGIVAAIRSLWSRKAESGQLPPAPAQPTVTAPGETPQSDSISITAPAEGVTEIVVRIRRD